MPKKLKLDGQFVYEAWHEAQGPRRPLNEPTWESKPAHVKAVWNKVARAAMKRAMLVELTKRQAEFMTRKTAEIKLAYGKTRKARRSAIK